MITINAEYRRKGETQWKWHAVKIDTHDPDEAMHRVADMIDKKGHDRRVMYVVEKEET